MKTTNHTPGPWAVSPYNNVTSRNGTVAKTEQMPGNDESEQKANANLIAAAPDLLEALKELVDLNVARNMNKAKAAIAKAEGAK